MHFRNRNQNSYELVAEIATVIIIIVIVFFYLWYETIDEFKLPWFYLWLVWVLLAQKTMTFVLKVTVFFPVYWISLCFQKC